MDSLMGSCIKDMGKVVQDTYGKKSNPNINWKVRYEELASTLVGDSDFSHTEVLGRAYEAIDALLEKEGSLNNE